MCENACGKLPTCRPACGSYSSASRPTSLRRASSRSKTRRASSRAAQQGEVVGQPEGAGQERPLARRQAVDRRLGRCSGATKPSRIRSRSIAATVPAHARVVGRQEADQRDHQQAGVELLRAVGLDEGARARRRSPRGRPRAWISSRSARQRSTGPSRPNCSTALTARSKRHPGHHLRVGEVPPRPAHLPDALVRLAPVSTRGSPSSACSRSQPASSGCQADVAGQVQGVEHLAVDVELELVARPRCRSGPAASPRSRAARPAPARSAAARRPRPYMICSLGGAGRPRRAAASRARRGPRRGSRRCSRAKRVKVASRSQQKR